jgi:hypothetical protein
MDPEQPGAAPSPPPPPPPSPPQAAASFAAVVADIPQAGFSALAAAASEQYAAVKASFQPPLEYDRLLAAGTASLVLLEGVTKDFFFPVYWHRFSGKLAQFFR